MSVQRTNSALAAGDRLPDLAFAATPDGRLVSLRTRGRLATVVVLLHEADCEGCRTYLRELADEQDALREWDGRILPIVPGKLETVIGLQGRARLPFPVLADSEGRCAERCGIEDAAVLIADQWGELYFVGVAGREHRFPSATEVADWLRFLAIQCPECEGEAR